MAGHSDRAPRLDEAGWAKLISHFKGLCERANSYGVRPVLHPHCGGYIEFGDEIDRLAQEIPNDMAGLVLDTGRSRRIGTMLSMIRKSKF